MNTRQILTLLPLGTIVKLDGSEKKVMVIGVCPRSNDQNGDPKMNDYIGVLYPEGYISSDFFMLFDHDQISEIVAEGYRDGAEWGEFLRSVEVIVARTD